MNPDTAEFARTLLRHQRGIVSSAKRYIESPEFSKEDALEVVGYLGKVLDAYERALSPSVSAK